MLMAATTTATKVGNFIVCSTRCLMRRFRPFATFVAPLPGACMRYSSAVLLLVALPLGAQGYPFSQRGSVSQSVAFTSIAVEYGRPVARGRLLFGDSGVVKWNAIWHPGADSATHIAFDHDVLIEGRPLAAGEYSLWLLPRNGAA